MASSETHERAARNQALFREVNERVEEISAHVPGPELVGFLCECASVECTAVMEMTVAEFAEVHRVPTHFPVLPGHELPGVERVVASSERYVVVEKYGEAGRIAVETSLDTG